MTKVDCGYLALSLIRLWNVNKVKGRLLPNRSKIYSKRNRVIEWKLLIDKVSYRTDVQWS